MRSPSVSRRAAGRGFTLVELLIVVVILALLAAVVIPQFNGTTAATKEASLHANLQAMRQSIALYRVQHNEIYPGATSASWAEFETQLTTATKADGTAGGSLGPYLRTGIPKNPFKDPPSNTGAIAPSMLPGPIGPEAYVYVPTTGELRANVVGTGPSGTAYWDL